MNCFYMGIRTFAIVLLATALVIAGEKPSRLVGKPAPDFKLTSVEGKTFSLSSLKGKLILLDFWSASCPISERYEEEFKKIQSQFGPRGLVLLGIAPNKNESAEEMGRVSKERSVNFPILLDPGNRVADLYQAQVTPHVYLVDKKGTVIYEGAVDNQGYFRKRPTRLYLREALEAALSGKTPPTGYVQPWGCSIKRQ